VYFIDIGIQKIER